MRHGRYQLSYRPGYSSGSPEVQLERALTSPLGIAALPSRIPMTMSFGDTTANGPQEVVPITATLDGRGLQLIPRNGRFIGRIHLYVSIFDRRGTRLGFHHFGSEIESPTQDQISVSVDAPLRLPHGAYRIVLTVRDEITNDLGIASGDVSL